MPLLNFPNALTCCNLVCGCLATGAAFHGHCQWAVALIVAGAVFDFFDGMAARALGISSPIGKELDSLADVVTFGVAPSAILFRLFGELQPLPIGGGWERVFPCMAFLMAAFSALRLAKFNLDERQHYGFIGLPTPANALFWGSLAVGEHDFLVSQRWSAVFLVLLMLLFCYLLVSEVPMLALKFRNMGWRDNRERYVFLLGCLPILLVWPLALHIIIIWYIAVSVAWDKWGGRL